VELDHDAVSGHLHKAGAAVPVAAATAWLAGDGELAGGLLVGGTGAWAFSKLVKQVVRRPRPVALLPGTPTSARISRSTSRAERRWGSPLRRRQAWSHRDP